MTKPTKAQLRKAKAWTLRTYRLALKAAKAGKWERAESLTSGTSCRFCRLFGASFGGAGCDSCAALHICNRNPQGNAREVMLVHRTPANGLRHFRRTIEQLEALEF